MIGNATLLYNDHVLVPESIDGPRVEGAEITLRWEWGAHEYAERAFHPIEMNPNMNATLERQTVAMMLEHLVAWITERSTTEYRLVVDKGYQINRYDKRDLVHAEKGRQDAIRDFGRYENSTGMSAWIESRTVTDWERADG